MEGEVEYPKYQLIYTVTPLPTIYPTSVFYPNKKIYSLDLYTRSRTYSLNIDELELPNRHHD